jgi:hypothetical protein
MATVTDAGGSQAALYDAVNSPGPLGGAVPLGCQCAKDPADETKMYWAILSDEGTIYFGDSFGSANDTSERFKPSPQAQYLLGAGLASDNQCLAYYTAIGTDGVGHAYGYKSQGAVTFDPIPGVGTISNGFGSWFSSGGDGLYLLGSEPRDGEVTGRFIVNGALTRTDLVAAPLEGLPTGDRSIAFITNTGGFEVLNRQNVPTAFRHSAASVGGTFTNSQLGLDTWAIPQAGASGTTAGEIILGSTYDPAVLVLSRFSAGNNVGDQLATFPDAAVYSICYNPALNRTGVAYTQNGGKDVLFRSWNGTVLSSAATVYTGTDALVEMVLKARPDGEWGVAWDDSASNVRLAETSSGTWQAPGTLSAQAVNFAVGSIGLGYAANNDAGIAVERSTGTTGLYFGLKPAGSGTATWELVSPSQGFNMKSISVNFMFGTTATLVYNDNTLGRQRLDRDQPAVRALRLTAGDRAGRRGDAGRGRQEQPHRPGGGLLPVAVA